jgi:IS30 family transposase
MAKKSKNKKKHLSDEERFCIEKMLGAHESFADIGRTLGRGKSTISEEVDRNGGRKKYRADTAIQRAYWKQYRKKQDCNKVACDGPLTRFVEEKLIKEKLSPGAISSRLKQQTKLQYTSEKSIRKFIGRRPGLEKNLFWNRNNHKGGRKRENKIFLTDPSRKFIEDRPLSALYTYGHWEMDFIVSKHNSWVLLVCVEKYSKKLKLALLPNRNNDLVNKTVTDLLRDEWVRTITTDNDIGFAKWNGLETMLRTQIYFCHPYHSWEKGLVENCNRWLREFIPKKTDLSRLSERNIKWMESWFNHKPRECLDGRTAHEVSVEKECGMIVKSLSVNFPEVRIRG